MRITFKTPERYKKMNSMPDDPPESIAYGCDSQGFRAFVLVFPIPDKIAMPYDNPQEVIDCIHEDLADDQGLIEVKTGETENGKKYIYSIVKTWQEDQGVQYFLLLHISYGNGGNMCVRAFFDEVGVIGMRDNFVYMMIGCREIWQKDPYDPDYKRGIRMNLSEREEFDVFIPDHPLSEARRFVSEITKMN